MCVCMHTPVCTSFPAGPGLVLCLVQKIEAVAATAAMATAGTDVVEKCGRCANCPFHTAPLMLTPSLEIMKQAEDGNIVFSVPATFWGSQLLCNLVKTVVTK